MHVIKKNFGGFRYLGRTQLMKIKLEALRAGVWFRALPRIDRALVDLTIKVSKSIRSQRLAKRIHAVTMKLMNATESRLSRAIREFGLPIALKLSILAQNWGYEAAESWAEDMNYARFLAVTRF